MGSRGRRKRRSSWHRRLFDSVSGMLTRSISIRSSHTDWSRNWRVDRDSRRIPCERRRASDRTRSDYCSAAQWHMDPRSLSILGGRYEIFCRTTFDCWSAPRESAG